MTASRRKLSAALLLALVGLVYLVIVTEPNPVRQRAAALRHQPPLYYEAETRAVNTDSLYRLYHAAMRSPQPDKYFQEIMCESFRLAVRNGAVPTRQAIKRMHDTLWSAAESERLPDLDRRLERTVNIDYKTCGMAWDTPRAPGELNDYPYDRAPASDSVARHVPEHTSKQP